MPFTAGLASLGAIRTTEPTEGTVMPKKLLLSIAAALAAFSLAACGADGDEAASEQTEQSQQGEQPLPETELDNIPGVVAVVHYREISGAVLAASCEDEYQL